jgi:hypothetical protein
MVAMAIETDVEEFSTECVVNPEKLSGCHGASGEECGRIEKVHNLLLSQRQDLVRVLPDLEGGPSFHDLRALGSELS